MTDAIVKAIVKSCYAGELTDRPEIIAAKLNAVRKIEQDVLDLRTKMRDETNLHEAALKKFDNELRAIRSRCGHECKTYHGDPSGGSDSCHICEICGAEL